MAWSAWKTHTPGQRPSGVEPQTLVEVVLMNGDTLAVLRADEIDWNCPGDQVKDYRFHKETMQ